MRPEKPNKDQGKPNKELAKRHVYKKQRPLIAKDQRINIKILTFIYGLFLPTFFLLSLTLTVIAGVKLFNVHQGSKNLLGKPQQSLHLPPTLKAGSETYSFLGFYEAMPGKKAILIRKESSGEIGAFTQGQKAFGGPQIKQISKGHVEVTLAHGVKIIKLNTKSSLAPFKHKT